MTIPCSAITTAIPSEARNSINLRPLRSARLPHSGDTSAETKNVPLNTSPDQILSDWWPLTPSCSTYSGRKGRIWLIASPVKKQPSQTEIRLSFHASISLSYHFELGGIY
ncbi:hypothetical protein D3C72_2251420 [compost metagenome]